MLRWTWLILAFVSLAGGPSLAARALPSTDKAKIDTLLENWTDKDAIEGAQGWDIRLVELLKKKPDVTLAAETLGREFKITAAQSQTLLKLWLDWTAVQETYLDDKDRRLMETDDRFVALVQEAKHPPFLVALAAHAMTWITRCIPGSYDRLVAGSADPFATGWIAVQGRYCDDWHVDFAKANPQHAVALWSIRMDVEIGVEERIALTEYLLSEAFSHHVTGGQAHYRKRLVRWYVWDVLGIGLADEALAAIENLPASERAGALTADYSGGAVAIDGLLTAARGGNEASYDNWSSYAAARFAKGDYSKAKETLAQIPYLAQAQKRFTCYTNSTQPECKEPPRAELDPIALEYLLKGNASDPYDLAEAMFAGARDGFSSNALWSSLMKSYFAGGPYEGLANESAKRWRPNYDDGDADVSPARKAAIDLLNEILGAPFQERVANLKAATRAKVIELGGDPDKSPWETTKRVQAAPPLFPAQTLPANIAPSSAEEKPAPAEENLAFGKLPDGFWPVRIEVQNKQAVAISLSQNFDQTGEVSAGGYWIHVSSDAGKTWQRPLYTGLAQFFPYNIVAKSNMALIAGDALNIEVEVQELDVASITYPPVGLVTKRRQKGLFIQLPLSALTRDKDSDGIPDIEERRLLLDPNNPDTDGDGLSDGRDSMPNVARSTTAQEQDAVMAAVLEKIFGEAFGAIIMKPDASDGPMATLSGLTSGEPVSRDRPIFVEGDPKAFGGFRPQKMMLVYSSEDLKRIASMVPDFHAIELVPFAMNRARDKGFIVWSAGWTGGTYRFTKVPTGWEFEQISGWIT